MRSIAVSILKISARRQLATLWYSAAIAAVALAIVACGGGAVGKGDIEDAAENFFHALSDDPPKAYTYLSADCRGQIGYLDFVDAINDVQGFAGEGEIEVRNVEIIERGEDRAVADFEVVLVSDGDEIPLEGEVATEGPTPFVREDGRWRFEDCAGFPIDGAGEEPPPETAEETPAPQAADPVEVEADDDPSLPGEFVDLQAIYGGYYGNDAGPSTAAHRVGEIDYSEQGLPPAGGPHWGSGSCGSDPTNAPPFCGPVAWGIYDRPWEAESLVHNMEHAGVIVWYNTSDRDVIEELRDFVLENNEKLIVMAPYPDMEAEHVAITVWSRRDKFPVSDYSRERLRRFIDTLYCRFDPEGFCR